MSLEKFQLFFNATAGEGDEVTAFLRTSGGGLLTSTTAGSKEALDVNIAASDISISVAESDVYAEDSAHVSGDDGAFMLAVRRDTRAAGSDADGDYSSLNVNASGELWVKDADVLAQLQSGVVVSATDLDIRDLSSATDSIAAVQSGTWSVEISDAGGSITVDALDFDIRDLSHTQDSIRLGDGTDFLAINADGSLNMTDNGGSLTVDAVDLDIRDLSAAQDSVAAHLNDGAGNAIESIGGNLSVADSVLINSLSAPAVTTTEVQVAAVTAQKKVTIQNLSAEDLYYGPSGVTTTTGLLLPKKSSQEIDLAGDLYLIAAQALPANSVRVAHWAAT